MHQISMVSDIRKEKTIMTIAKLTTFTVLELEDIKGEIMSITPCPLMLVYLAVVTRVY